MGCKGDKSIADMQNKFKEAYRKGKAERDKQKDKKPRK